MEGKAVETDDPFQMPVFKGEGVTEGKSNLAGWELFTVGYDLGILNTDGY